MSHFPMYLAQKLPGQADSQEQAPQDAAVLSQEAWYTAEQCEYEGHSKDCKPKVRTTDTLCTLQCCLLRKNASSLFVVRLSWRLSRALPGQMIAF